jgi:chromosome segregation ATPase
MQYLLGEPGSMVWLNLDFIDTENRHRDVLSEIEELQSKPFTTLSDYVERQDRIVSLRGKAKRLAAYRDWLMRIKQRQHAEATALYAECLSVQQGIDRVTAQWQARVRAIDRAGDEDCDDLWEEVFELYDTGVELMQQLSDLRGVTFI